MTTKTVATATESRNLRRFPDFPPRDDMQTWNYLNYESLATSLRYFLRDNRHPRVTVESEVPVWSDLSRGLRRRIPDLMVIFGGDRELMLEQKGYEIVRQGNPPALALEVASESTGDVDYTAKRRDYELFGIGEYWRFDPTGGDYHGGVALAGDRLVDGRYEPIPIEETEDGALRAYSEALDMYIYWNDGSLEFYDPRSGTFIRRWGELQAHANAETARAEVETAARVAAEARASELASRNAELEAELRRLRGDE